MVHIGFKGTFIIKENNYLFLSNTSYSGHCRSARRLYLATFAGVLLSFRNPKAAIFLKNFSWILQHLHAHVHQQNTFLADKSSNPRLWSQCRAVFTEIFKEHLAVGFHYPDDSNLPSGRITLKWDLQTHLQMQYVFAYFVIQSFILPQHTWSLIYALLTFLYITIILMKLCLPVSNILSHHLIINPANSAASVSDFPRVSQRWYCTNTPKVYLSFLDN